MRIIENCFLREQLAACTFEPHLNAVPATPDVRFLFLESNVIRTLVEDGWHAESDYFGVVSHRWRTKLDEARRWSLPIRNIGRGSVTHDALAHHVAIQPRPDFVSFGRYVPQHVFEVADTIHPGFRVATEALLRSIGIRFDLSRKIPDPIYFNYFIGTRAAMAGYVSDLLAPAIDAAAHDPDLRALCFRDAGYFRPFPPQLRELYGFSHYPLCPFIGERLINVYTALSGARVLAVDDIPGASWIRRTLESVRPAAYSTLWTVQRWRRSFAPVRAR